MPGELEGSPALTFAPLPKPEQVRNGSLYAEMRNRFEAYKRVVAKPFFRTHFARLDRQVVLVDGLAALAKGPRALGDLTAGMAATLSAFRHGQSSWFDRLTGARRIDRLLFAVSKADHLHHSQHPALTRLVQGMLAEAAEQARFRGAETRAIALAAIRATSEQEVTRNGDSLRLVRGLRWPDRREIAVFPGTMPEDTAELISTAALARESGEDTAPEGWPGRDFAAVAFAPPRWGDGGPPHLRLDAALDFLIGDRLE